MEDESKPCSEPKKVCECGCGKEASLFTTGRGKNKKLRRFIWGHHKPAGQGKNHACWKGGRVRQGKYVMLYQPEHHFSQSQGYVMEHRLVWEKYNNAILLPWADVHHLDGNTLNNSIENLEAMTHIHHKKTHQIKYRQEVMSKRKCRCGRTNPIQWYKHGEEFICDRCYKSIWYKNRYLGEDSFISSAT